MKTYIDKLKKVKPNWNLLILFFVFFIFFRWNSFEMPFERDEGDYSYSAWIMREGLLPYQNSIVQKPPPIIYTYLISQLMFGDNMYSPRIIAAVFSILSSWVLFKITKLTYGNKVAWITIFLFIPIVTSPINSGLAANTEIFMLLPFLVFIYIYLRYRSSGNKIAWFSSGVFSALAVLFKPICIYAVLYVYIVWIISEIKKGKYSQTFLNIGKAFLAGVITSLITVAPFIIQGVWNDLWEQVVVFNSFYAKHWGYGPGALIMNLGIMAKSFWPLYILFGLFILFKPKLWKFYLGLFLFSLFGAYQTNIRHYLIIIMPFLALMSAVSIENLGILKLLGKKETYLTILVLAFIIWPVRKQFSLSPDELSLWVYGTENPFYESEIVAQKLASVTEDKDCVFIAGSEAQILYYAKRFSCTRYMSTYIFTIDTPIQSYHQENTLRELKENKPQAIVFSNKVHSGLLDAGKTKLVSDYINSLLKSDFELLGGWVWGIKGGKWVDKLNDEEVRSASLVLYKRK